MLSLSVVARGGIIYSMRLYLVILVGLSLLLRVIFTTVTPPEMFGDELDVGYQAYSLLKTGKDIYSQVLPIYIHSLSEWRAPVIVYQIIPGIAFLGLNEHGVRMSEIVMGAIAPVIIFLIALQTTKSKGMAMFAGLTMAVMPWHTHFSRMAGFGVVTLTNFLMLAVLLVLRRRYVLSALFFALAFYTYNSAFVFIPLLLILLAILGRSTLKLSFWLILGVLCLPLVYITFLGPVAGRFNQLSIFSSSEVVDKIVQYRPYHSPLVGRLLYNRPGVWLEMITSNYLKAFSPEFLFVRGDPVYRHSPQVVGGLFPIFAPLVVIGVIALIRRKSWLWLGWLLLAPIPSALTVDGGFHATRLFLMVPPLAVAIGAGLSQLRRPALAIVSIIFLVSFAWVGIYYFTDYPRLSWVWWHVGYKDIMTQLPKLAQGYSHVFINNTYEPSLVRFLFWTKYDPARFQQEFTLDQSINAVAPDYDGFSLGDKYFFGQFSQNAIEAGITNSIKSGDLYLISQREDVAGDWDWRVSPPQEIKVLHTSTNPVNQPLMYLITKNE